MTRNKIRQGFITNNMRRKATYKQRTKGFLKKLKELKILCGVEACAIIYSPDKSSPEVWPPGSEVNSVLDKFDALPEAEQTLRSFTHEEYLAHEIARVKKKTERLSEGNNEKLSKELMFACLDGKMKDLVMDDSARANLCKVIDQHLKDIYHHVNVTVDSNPNFEIGESSSTAVVMDMPPIAMARDMPSTATVTNMTPIAMATDIPPMVMAEAGSSSFQNVPIFNSPQATNEPQPLVTSNHGPEHVSSYESQFLNVPTFNVPQQTNEAMAKDMPPMATTEACSSSSKNNSVFNSPQLTNEYSQPILISNHGLEYVSSNGCQFLNVPTSNFSQQTNEGMTKDMPPMAMAEAGSSSSWNAPIFNSLQPTNDSQPLVTSNHGPEHASSHESRFLNVPTFNFPQQTKEAMTKDMPPMAMVEAGSSSFRNVSVFNSPQLTNEYSQPLLIPNHGPEYVNSHGCQLLNVPTFNFPQQTNEVQSTMSSNHGPRHISSYGSQFLNVPTFNFPQQTNDVQSTISSNHGLEHVHSRENNFMNAPIFNNEVQQPIISSNQRSNHVGSLANHLLPIRDQRVNTPVINQGEGYYPPNQQDWYIEEMMKHYKHQHF